MPADSRETLAREIAERALRASMAPEAEVMISGGREALTRFAGNTIHQNLTRESMDISIRAAVGKKTGRASTTNLEESALRETAARALAIAERVEESPDLLPLPDPYPSYPKTRCWDSASAAASPDVRARGAKTVIDLAAGSGMTAAGSFASEDRFQAIANRRGLFAYGEYTSATLSTTMTAREATGYAEDAAVAIGRIDPATLARKAIEKASMPATEEIPPGDYTAILEPAAVAELLVYLVYGSTYCQFSGLALVEGQSFFTGRMNQKLFGDNITLRDDILHPHQWGIPFDGEGVPRQSLVLIDRGVATGLTYDRATAKKAGVPPTGHGLPVPTVHGSEPQNVVLEGGTTSVEAMIKDTPRGILITRLWYNRLVDPADLIVTGLTRDGTFLIEDGRIVKSLRNYRFNQSVRAMLNQVTALSPTVRAGWNTAAPALRVEGFRLSSVVPRDPTS